MATLQLAIDARGAKVGAGQYAAAQAQVQAATLTSTRSIQAFDARVARLSTTAGLLRGAFGAIGIAAVGVAFVSATRTIAKFEETMATVGAVAGASGDTLAELTQQARELGATTRFTATEAGEGLLFLARAGFSAQEAIEAIPSTLDLAAAGMLSLGEASDHASNILRQFDLSADETTRVVDVLVRTANAANTDVRQLAEAMSFAGTIAGKFGITVETTAAAIGTLGDSGIQSSRAGTGLRMVLLSLANPSREAEKALSSLGISMDEVNPATNDLVDIFERLAESGLLLKENVNLAGEIFSARAAASALTLAGSVEKLRSQFNLQGLSAKEVAQIMDDNLAGAFRNLRSAIDEAFLSFGDTGFTGGMRNLVDAITDGLRVLTGMDEELRTNREMAEFAAKALKGIAGALSAVIAIKAAVFFTDLALVMGTAAASVLGLSAAMAPATALFKLASIAAVGLTAALSFYGDELVTVRGKTAEVSDFIAAAWDVLAERAAMVWAVITEIFSRGFTVITNNAGEGLEALDKEFSVRSFAIQRGWESTWDYMLDVLKAFGNTAIAVVLSPFTAIAAMTDPILEVGDALSKIDYTSPIAAGQAIIAFKNAFTGTGSGLAEAMKESFQTDFIGQMAPLGKEAGDTFLDAMERNIESFSRERFANAFDIEGIMDEIADRADTSKLLRELEEGNAEVAEDLRNAFADVEMPPEVLEAIDMYNRKLNEMNEAAARASTTVMQMIASLEFEQTLVSKTAEDRELATALRYLEANATEEEIERIDELTEAYRKEHETLVRLQKVRQAADVVASGIGTALQNVVFGTQSLEEAIESLIRGVTEELFNLLVTQQLVKAISSGISAATSASVSGGGGMALGGVIDRGRVIPAQQGMVLDRPTFMPISGGRTVLAGEAGAEGILPLGRTSGGELGVKVAGQGQGGGGQHITQVFNIQTPDVKGFRQSRRQILDDARRGMQSPGSFRGL